MAPPHRSTGRVHATEDRRGARALQDRRQVARSMLFGIAPTDGVTYAGVVLLVIALALIAALLPALRAASSSSGGLPRLIGAIIIPQGGTPARPLLEVRRSS